MQLPQSTHPFAFLGTGLGTSPEAAAPFHKLDWCWFTLKEALGVGQPWARCECSVLTLAWTGGADGGRGVGGKQGVMLFFRFGRTGRLRQATQKRGSTRDLYEKLHAR